MNTTLDGLEGYFTFVTNTQIDRRPARDCRSRSFVTPNLFSMLGRTAMLGRTFTVGEAAGTWCSATATGGGASAATRPSSARR